jgi:hypothetical protein
MPAELREYGESGVFWVSGAAVCQPVNLQGNRVCVLSRVGVHTWLHTQMQRGCEEPTFFITKPKPQPEIKQPYPKWRRLGNIWGSLRRPE